MKNPLFNGLDGAQLATLNVIRIMLPRQEPARATHREREFHTGRPFRDLDGGRAFAAAMHGQHRGAVRPGYHTGLPDAPTPPLQMIHEPRTKRLSFEQA